MIISRFAIQGRWHNLVQIKPSLVIEDQGKNDGFLAATIPKDTPIAVEPLCTLPLLGKLSEAMNSQIETPNAYLLFGWS